MRWLISTSKESTRDKASPIWRNTGVISLKFCHPQNIDFRTRHALWPRELFNLARRIGAIDIGDHAIVRVHAFDDDGVFC